MELLPNDIRQHTFKRGVRGYDREEVEQFLEHVAEALEDALNGRREAEDRTRKLKVEIERFKKLEESLKEAVVTAQKAMTKAQQASSQETESLKRAAQNEAMAIVQEAETKRNKMDGEIRYLQQLRFNHVQQFRAFLNAQLKTLDMMEHEPESVMETDDWPKAKAEPLRSVDPPKPVAKPEPPRPTPEDVPTLHAEEPAEPEIHTPKPWQPERIERREEESSRADTMPTRAHDSEGGDEDEAMVAYPPPLFPREEHRGE